MKSWKTYKTLFTSTFYLSTFVFGGGYVIVPLMKKKFVEDLKWIEEEEMLNLVAVAQSSPGAIVVNTSILLGYKIGGFLGAIVTVLGAVLPPFITVAVISYFYTAFSDNKIVAAVLRGMQSGVAAVIIDAVMSMGFDIIKEKKLFSMAIMVLAFLTVFFLKINVVYIILVCALLGVIYVYRKGRKTEAAAQNTDGGSEP